LYLDYCGNCHGADAAGGVVGKEIYDKEYRDALEKVREGEGGDAYAERDKYMPRFGQALLNNEEVQAIADYLATLGE
jgi:mono/diheme cytochrome c family protein